MPNIISANFGALSGLSNPKGRSKKTPSGPDQVASRQQTVMAADIARVRRSIAVAPLSTVYRNKHFMPCAVLDTSTSSPSSRLLQDVKAAWDKAAALARTQKYVDELSAMAINPNDANTQPTLPPGSATESSSETAPTEKAASSDSQQATARKLADLQWLIKQKDGNYTILEKKYEAQLAQRVNDKARVDQAQHQCDAADEDFAELKAESEATRIEHDQAVKQLQAQLKMKDQEKAKLQDSHQCAIAVLLDSHKKDLAAKQDEIKQALSLFTLKQESLKNYERVAKKEKKELANAASTNRKAANEKIESLEQDIRVLNADYADAINDNGKLVKDLVRRNKQLEKEHRCMSDMVKRTFPDNEGLHEIIDNNFAGLQDEKDSRAKIKQLSEQNENLLDKIQQMGAHYTKHQRAEQAALSAATHKQNQIHDLMNRNVRQKGQLRDAAIQYAQISATGASGNDVFAALLGVEYENEALRKEYIKERSEKERIQRDADKYDSEALSLSVAYECAQAELIEFKRDHNIWKDGATLAMEEAIVLRQVIKDMKESNLNQDNTAVVWSWVNEKIQEAHAAIQKNLGLTKQLEEFQRDKLISDRKWSLSVANQTTYIQMLEQWFYNEAVPTTERLHDEIHALKAEKGESHWIQSAQPVNEKVADRNALRCAAMKGLDSVDPSRIPSAVHNPNFIADSIPATYEALINLRRNGYYPHCEAGKVWMKRKFEPLSEDAAAAQLQAEEQKDMDERSRSIQTFRPSVNDTAPPAANGRSTRNQLVPPQVRKAAMMKKPVTRTAFPVAKRPVVQKDKGRHVQQLLSTQASAGDGLPWESRFAKFPDMTEDQWNESDRDIKEYFLETYVKDD